MNRMPLALGIAAAALFVGGVTIGGATVSPRTIEVPGPERTVTVTVPGPERTIEVPGPRVEVPVFPQECIDYVAALEQLSNARSDAFNMLRLYARGDDTSKRNLEAIGAAVDDINREVDRVNGLFDACYGLFGAGSPAPAA